MIVIIMIIMLMNSRRRLFDRPASPVSWQIGNANSDFWLAPYKLCACVCALSMCSWRLVMCTHGSGEDVRLSFHQLVVAGEIRQRALQLPTEVAQNVSAYHILTPN